MGTGGDGHAMYKLAVMERDENNFPQYEHWLEKSAEAKHFDAMKEFAKFKRDKGDYATALALYKELAKDLLDVESMEIIVDMCEQSQGVPEKRRRHAQLCA